MTSLLTALNLINRYGSTVILRKNSYTGTGTAPGGQGSTTQPWDRAQVTYTDYPVKALIRRYSPQELSGLVQQGDREARMAAAALSVTPAVGDEIQIDGRLHRIKAVDTRSDGESPVLHVLIMRG